MDSGRLRQFGKSIHQALGGPDGFLAVLLLGHRQYVGGAWDEIGNLQAEFMRQMGLEPAHVFLDIACGSLRGGVRFIKYLDRGNYLGIDREPRLIKIGIAKELGRAIHEEKVPEFVVSSSFEFEKFTRKPNFALAQSLFTHLEERDILDCLSKLRAFVDPGMRFFATYFIGYRSKTEPRSHSLRGFVYTREQVEGFGATTGWKSNYIGAWGHPRNQMMVEYTAAMKR
jgi:SAM-dependent methyltransferase